MYIIHLSFLLIQFFLPLETAWIWSFVPQVEVDVELWPKIVLINSFRATFMLGKVWFFVRLSINKGKSVQDMKTSLIV